MTDAAPDDATRWLTVAELQAWMPFSAMLMNVLSALDSQLQRDAKLSLFGYLVLAGLSEAPERTLPMSDLAILANGSPSRLSHAVSKLERAGWVVRSPCPGNGRVTVATLTDAGYDKVAASAPEHVKSVRDLVVDQLPLEQLESLGEASRAILARARCGEHTPATGSEAGRLAPSG
ncbi:MAG TPA: MarR family transcriptional regulator [Pseudonocardia sp.]|jgi:DNA-binding MarR family transcriptional regulator|nr:MarR family transcriptional regulator [Pseudonocardia sp.]